MKLIACLLLFLYSTCNKTQEGYTIKIKHCDWLPIPCDLVFKEKVAGSVYKVVSMNGDEFIAKLKIEKEFTIINGMKIQYVKPWVGNPYLKVHLDSASTLGQRPISFKDTIIADL